MSEQAARPGMGLGAHVVHLLLAVMLAWQAASGWSVLPATFVFWVGLVLLSSLLDGLGRRDAAPSEIPTLLEQQQDVADGRGVEPWPVAASQASLPLVDAIDNGRREWRRRLRDIEPYFEERFPREGICSVSKYFLRRGDVLVMAYLPAAPNDPLAWWHCELRSPDRADEVHYQVGASRETYVPIIQTGVHEFAVGQGGYGSAADGIVKLWLKVPNADALSLPVEIARESRCAYEIGADARPVARITAERVLQSRGALPISTDGTIAAGSALLFSSPGHSWDTGVQPIASERAYRAQYTHISRDVLHLCKGDVLCVEFLWTAAEFDVPLAFDDHSTSQTSASLRLKKFVRGPSVLHVGDGSQGSAITVVCPDDGFYTLELELFGPAEWRRRLPEEFLRLRLWGAFLQRPASIRDFDLKMGWVEDWYEQLMPVPRGTPSLGGCEGDVRV